jgi:hypothetical protein
MAAIGMTCFVSSVVFLLHSSGIRGLWAFGENAFVFFAALLLLATNVWMVLLYFSRQRKETK